MTAYPTEAGVGRAIVTALNTALGANRAGYGQKPTAGGGTVASFASYAVVYPGSSQNTGGTVAAPNADATHSVQVTYIGLDPQQADVARDKGRSALLTGPGTALTVTGRTAWLVELGDSTTTRLDDTVQPPLWYAVDRYLIHTTPA